MIIPKDTIIQSSKDHGLVKLRTLSQLSQSIIKRNLALHQILVKSLNHF
jgi:hypothetical protein